MEEHSTQIQFLAMLEEKTIKKKKKKQQHFCLLGLHTVSGSYLIYLSLIYADCLSRKTLMQCFFFFYQSLPKNEKMKQPSYNTNIIMTVCDVIWIKF